MTKLLITYVSLVENWSHASILPVPRLLEVGSGVGSPRFIARTTEGSESMTTQQKLASQNSSGPQTSRRA